VRAWQIVIANVGALATPPFTWGPGIDPTDGVLDLCVFSIRRPRDYVRMLWNIVTGRHLQNDLAEYHPVKERLEVACDRPMLIQGDGELIGRCPIGLGITRGWIRVVVPNVAEKVLPPDEVGEAEAREAAAKTEAEEVGSAGPTGDGCDRGRVVRTAGDRDRRGHR
jgi:hypothetical protein